ARGCGDTLMSLTTCLWPRSASACGALREPVLAPLRTPPQSMSAHGCGHTLASLTASVCAVLAALRLGLRLAVRVGSCSASGLRLGRDDRTLRPARGAKAVNKGTVRRPRDLALSARQTLLCIGLVAGCVRRFS